MSQVRTNSIVPVGGIPAGASGGGIIQVVSASKTTTFSTTSTTFVDLTDLSVSITPRSASNKILIRYSVNCSNSSNNDASFFVLVRGSTQIFLGNGSSQTEACTSTGNTYGLVSTPQGVFVHNMNTEYLDSPSTTSSTTYKVQARVTGGTCHVNRRGDSNTQGTVSSITVMEVSG